ncbi:MAG: hypothetical protein KDJ52_33275 [Anaerolineae bacterium]|nr:hypothetical protein [Anaerolineae bacterium]
MSNRQKFTMLAYGLTAFTLGVLWSFGYISLPLSLLVGTVVVIATEWLMSVAER